uniref:Uncharacterized protein n=1 Tax=Anguilla anguilla TaxID=7936 RepID=A0A0E9U2E7_ANGAN
MYFTSNCLMLTIINVLQNFPHFLAHKGTISSIHKPLSKGKTKKSQINLRCWGKTMKKPYLIVQFF